MRYALFASVLSVVVLMLAVGRPGAEQVEPVEAMVLRTYDFSPFYAMPPWYLPPVEAVVYPMDSAPQEETQIWIEEVLKAARQIAGWEFPDEGQTLVTHDSKLVAFNTPAKLKALDTALRTVFPRYFFYQFRIALLSAKGAKFPGTVREAVSFDDALEVFRAAKFDVAWLSAGSIVPGRMYRLVSGRMTRLVNGQEGLIANLAVTTGPYVRYYLTGSALSIGASEDGNRLALDLSYDESRIAGVRTTLQNGNEISLPDIPYFSFKKRMAFDAPGTRSIAFEFHGDTRVLLFELEGFRLPVFSEEQE